MAQFQSLLFLTLVIALCNIIKKAPVSVDARFFEYELPNRSITICPSYSLVSLECPQLPSSSPNHHSWQLNLPKYLLSIDYIRSFPLRLGYDVNSCQPDLTHGCNNYDLRYINTLCNGKAQCAEVSAYQVRERSLCAFKAVTEIGFHCVPTWNLDEIQIKRDICENSSFTNDYGFIYSRNYPTKTIRQTCFTTIYAKANHKIILYFVNGELNHDQLRIESVTAEGLPILNISLNGNLSTQILTASTYEIKITFIPSQIYSYHPTYYLLYFYMIPICTFPQPCPPPEPPLVTTTPWILPTTTSRMRIQSVGWTKIPNIWIIIPVILAYILLLLLIVLLALLFRRRRKQQKLLTTIEKNLSSRYVDTSGASSRAQLVTPIPPPNNNPIHDIYPPHPRRSTSPPVHYPLPTSSFAQNTERYYRESQSDFDLHHNSMNGIDYRHHASIPYRVRPTTSTGNYRGYDTVDYGSYNYDGNRRRSLPKSFSDCDLCKRRVIDEEYQQYYNEQDDSCHLERRGEARSPRDKIKERIRERILVRQNTDSDVLPSASTTTVEYSTVLPRHQRITSDSNGPVHHLPFEYIPNENPNNIRTVEFKRNLSQERLPIGNNQQQCITSDENGTTNFTVKFYERDDDDNINNPTNRFDRCLHDAREVHRMSEQQNFNRHQYYHQQQRRFTGDNSDV